MRAARLVPIGEFLAELAPPGEIQWAQVERVESPGAASHSGDEADRAAHDRARRGMLAAGGAALVVASGAEVVLQVVVGAGQVRHVVAVEEAWPVTASHLKEVPHGGTEGARGRLSCGHLGQEGGVRGADLVARPARLVHEQVSCPMDPLVGHPDVGPERGGHAQPTGQQEL